MSTKRIAAMLAICGALAACDRSIPNSELTAPSSHKLRANIGDPGSGLYDWTDVSSNAPIGPLQAATGGRATGHWELAAPTGNRADEQASFTALSTNPAPTAKGEVQLHTVFVGDLDSRVHLDVDCLRIVGNQAWFSGPARRWVLGGVEQPPGLYLVFRVVDGGEGAGATPDMHSPAFSGPPMACALQPVFPLFPSANGNIQVQQK